MHLINSFLFKDTPSGDDVLYTALINKANVLGYTLPSAPTLSALNTLIKDMRRIGMIQRLDLFHVYASDSSGDIDFRLINIVNPEMIGEVNGRLEWYNDGSLGTGTLVGNRGFIDTLLNPYSGGFNYTQNNASMGAVITEDNSTNRNNSIIIGSSLNMFGGEIPGTLFGWNGIETYNIDTQRINNPRGVNLPSAVNLTGRGLKCINRSSSTQVSVIEKHTLSNFSVNSGVLQNENIHIHNSFVYNNNNPISNLYYYGVNKISCAFAGASIPFEMAQNFRQVYNKYLRTIGLQQVA